MSEYKGPERRSGATTRRSFDFYQDRGKRNNILSNYSIPHEASIIMVKDDNPKLKERRVMGAGRRKTDFAEALKTGEPVVLDVSKTPKSAFKGKGLRKLASKAGKIGKLGLAAVSLYDMVNRNK